MPGRPNPLVWCAFQLRCGAGCHAGDTKLDSSVTVSPAQAPQLSAAIGEDDALARGAGCGHHVTWFLHDAGTVDECDDIRAHRQHAISARGCDSLYPPRLVTPTCRS